MTCDDTLHSASSVNDCRVLELGRAGVGADLSAMAAPSTTSVANVGAPLSFDVRRVYYLYDVPADSERGGHSHHRQSELLVAVAGSLDVELFDGGERRTVCLNRPWKGLLITPGIWRTLNNFSAGAVCLVMSSGVFDEDDYVRSYDEFMELASKCPERL